MHQPRKPVESPVLIIVGICFFIGSYLFSPLLCYKCVPIDDTKIDTNLLTLMLVIVGGTLFYGGVSKGLRYMRTMKLIDNLSISGQSIDTVIVMRRAISGGKNRGTIGYEYLSKSWGSEKIYGSEMIREDRYHPGQRVDVWIDLSNPERYWVDLESVRDETAESRAFLEAYLDTRGRGFFDELAHIYDDLPGGRERMKLILYMLTPVKWILEKSGIIERFEAMNTLYKRQMKVNSENEKGSN